jgi:CDP-glycerol glycerophosphotransferase
MLHKIKKILSRILSPLKLLPLKKNSIIIQSSLANIYTDNPRFLFEFLSKKGVNIYWFTNNLEIKNYLKKNNFKYIYSKNFIKRIWITLKAKVIIDGGSDYYNFLNLIDSNAIKICIGHGSGLKVVKAKYIISKKFEDYSKFNYINFTSNFTIKKLGIEKYNLPSSKIIKFGYPRFEVLKKKSNSMLNYVLDGKNCKKKIIYYSPTWRPYDYNFPLLNLKNFNLVKFNTFLEENNCYFFYTYNLSNLISEIDEKKKYKNIIYIDRNKKPFFDTTIFLNEIDLLINDCSTTTTECSFIGKPQIHVFPDFKKYKEEKGFLISYRKNIAGPFCGTYRSFIINISKYINYKNNYLERYKSINKKNLNLFYDLKDINSNYKFYYFIKKIIKHKNFKNS